MKAIPSRTIGPGSWWATPRDDPTDYPLMRPVGILLVDGRLERYLDGWVIR